MFEASDVCAKEIIANELLETFYSASLHKSSEISDIDTFAKTVSRHITEKTIRGKIMCLYSFWRKKQQHFISRHNNRNTSAVTQNSPYPKTDGKDRKLRLTS
jgi:hypothetical protein